MQPVTINSIRRSLVIGCFLLNVRYEVIALEPLDFSEYNES